MNDISEAIARAQTRAAELFAAIEQRQLIRAGETEESVSRAIYRLAELAFGSRTHWHRRVVRAGPNTRLPFSAKPADRAIETDDIVSLDLGPVFDGYEADFGRSYVVGTNAKKRRLRDDLARLFERCRADYRARPSLTGAQLYSLVVDSCAERGWGFGGSHAGHLVGPFPLSREARDAARNRIRPDNDVPMNAPDERGDRRHWILEIHLLDPSGTFGGFYEDTL